MSGSDKNPQSLLGRRKPALSIRARLIILALLAITPLLLERVHGLEKARSERIARANNEVMDLAWRGVEAQREIIYSVRGLVQIVSRVYAKMPLDTPGCNAYLTDLTANIPWIRDVSRGGHRRSDQMLQSAAGDRAQCLRSAAFSARR